MMETKILDNLGLVAGMYDELGIGELIDEWIPQDHEQRHVSIGQCVKAMVLNGLGFTNERVYLLPKFFETKPIERLFGAGVCAEYFNDDALGRALDSLYKTGLTPLFACISSQAMKQLEIIPSFGHLDSTTFSVFGVYNSDQELVEGEIHIKQGYSRDHRPDLNQVGLALISEHQAGIPFLMKPLNGNSNDNKEFREIIKSFAQNLRDVEGVETFVADSALYSRETVELMHENEVKFVSRVPASVARVGELIELGTSEERELADLGDGYEYFEDRMDLGGIDLRLIVIRSEKGATRSESTLKKKILRESLSQTKSYTKLKKREFACEEDTQRAIELFQSENEWLDLNYSDVGGKAVWAKPGRPADDDYPEDFHYMVDGPVVMSVDAYEKQLRKKGWFVLVTNQLDREIWPAQRLLEVYKNQGVVERGFRFLKSPEFLSHRLFIKTPRRIEALLMIMTLCLLVYSAIEYKIREVLKNEEPFWPDQLKKLTTRPTARWVFSCFHGIHELLLEGRRLVLNQKPEHQRLLKILGPPYLPYYEENSGYVP
ncbi:IS1634 family transposase [bacterium]|jgi:transposase|nr:IS1634 family transposase [bacterium]